MRGKPPGLPGVWFRPERLRWLILPVLSLVISVLLFPNILIRPKIYGIGDVAEKDIKASQDFLIENRELTEKNREGVVKEVLSIYDFDNSASDIASRIKEAFTVGRESFTNTPQTVKDQKVPASKETISPDAFEEESKFKNQFFEILEFPTDENIFDQLMEFRFPIEVEKTITRLLVQVFKKGLVGNRMMLMSQIEKGGITLHEISSKKEITVIDKNRFFDLEGAKSYIESQRNVLSKSLNSPVLAALSIKLALSLVKPNLTFNKRETEERKDLARKSIKPTYFRIKKGEMIVREGERIGPDHLLKLSEIITSQKWMDMLSQVPGMIVLIGFLLSVIYMTGVKGSKLFRADGRGLIFTSVTLVILFLSIWAYDIVAEEVARGVDILTIRSLLFALPVACGAMLISVFLGISIAIPFSLVAAVLTTLITGETMEFFIYFVIGSLAAAYGVRNYTERGILIKTGINVGLINIVLSLSINMIYGSLYTMDAIVAAASGFVGGILIGVISTGIIPLIEMSFGFTTDIKLLELASLDQPLLRELMVQTPGTYHHCVIVSNMVEATAKAIQANPLLAKVSAYYHDIGKMKKPLYFIENQMGGENRHEKLAPSMSSLVLISHVKDGLELANKQKLGREIIDIIQQHHGTNLISYFYQKAKEQAGNKGGKSSQVKEEDFRYPGPKPQTKEAGLVMLADMVEAASRSLVDPTPSRIQGMAQKIINRVFSDGQLDECELTLKDLHEIAKSFNKTLSGIFHQRVEYPEVATKTAKKGVNGNTDQVSAEDSGAKKQEGQEGDEAGLRRLGLS